MPFWGLTADKPPSMDIGEHNGPKNKNVEGPHTESDGYGEVHVAGFEGGDHMEHVQQKLDADGSSNEFEIVLPKPNELQLDYDSPEIPERFTQALSFLTDAYCKINQHMTYRVTVSRHGNRHITISLPCEINDTERVAWQSVFGSDWKRDASSLMSIARNVKHPSLLFEKIGGQPIETGIKVRMAPPQPAGRKWRD